ncbi:hypothetical protein MTO96_032751 [Rhipicephalus appendiculatus]
MESTETRWNRRRRCSCKGAYFSSLILRASWNACILLSKGQQTSRTRASSPRARTRSGRRPGTPICWFSPMTVYLPRAAFLRRATMALWRSVMARLCRMQWQRTCGSVSSPYPQRRHLLSAAGTHVRVPFRGEEIQPGPVDEAPLLEASVAAGPHEVRVGGVRRYTRHRLALGWLVLERTVPLLVEDGPEDLDDLVAVPR